jgi:hypothetical protein
VILYLGNGLALRGGAFFVGEEMTWQLLDIYREVTHLAQSGTALQYKQRDGLTAYGNAAPLTVGQDVPEHVISAATYVYRGGYTHTTDDPDIAQLWIDSGFDVEEL